MRTLRSCRGGKAVAMVAVVFFCWMASRSEAQFISDEVDRKDSANGDNPIWAIMHGTTKRSVEQMGRVENPMSQRLVMPPLPGEQAFTDSLKDETKFGTATTYGPNKTEDYQLLFPPLTELQRMAKSKPLQKMYKEMITSEIPVMGQTFMMVENGAASGYFQSINLVSNTLASVMQANDFQMKIMDLTDPTGEMKNVWISDVFKKTQEGQQGEGKQGWGAALLSAAGDKTSFAENEDKFDKDLNGEPFDFKVLQQSSPADEQLNGVSLNEDKEGKKKFFFLHCSSLLAGRGGRGMTASMRIEELLS